MISASNATTDSQSTLNSLSYVNSLILTASSDGLFRIFVESPTMNDDMMETLINTYGYKVTKKLYIQATYPIYLIDWFGIPVPSLTPTPTPSSTPTGFGSSGFQWMTINSVTSTTASGIGQNDITLSVTQSGGGMGATEGVFNPTAFPEEYGVPFTGTQIQNVNSGTFTATFSQPVTDALVAFSSIGNGGLYVPIEVSAPFTPIFGSSVTYQNPVNGTQYTQLTGNEGYAIIRIDGTVTGVTFNYTESENYCNVCFGFVNQNNLPTPTPTKTPTITPTPSVTPSGFTTSNLVLHYDPSNVSSYPGTGTTITDLSGNGRNGTMSNISFTSPYFTYNGSSSQISVADNALLEPGSGDWTVEVWVNQAVAGNDVVLGKFNAGGLSSNVGYSIRTTASTFYGQYGSGSGSGATLFVNSTNHTATLNTWYQLVYVFTNVAANTFQTFVNGSSIGSVGHSLASILNTSTNLYIGSYNGGEYAQYFDGKIGITRLYNRALTSTEVLNNYNNDIGKYI